MLNLVTGATGFLGSHLVDRLLAGGHQVRALARTAAKAEPLRERGIEIALGDVTEPASLVDAVAGCHAIYHLAAHVSDWGPWETFHKVTVQGTENVFAAAAKTGVKRIVLVSTALVYDDRFARKARVVDESAPLNDGDRDYGHYSKAKVQAEEVAWKYHREGKIALSVIRPTWIYGPRDFTILPRLLEHFEGPLACWVGRKDPSADPIFVTDVADAAILAVGKENAIGEAFNIAPDPEIRLRQFLGALFQELEIKEPKFTVPLPAANAITFVCENWARLIGQKTAPEMTRAGIACITVDQHVNPAKAIRELDWRPQVSLEEGARRTAEWLKGERAKGKAQLMSK
jgi:nucleoside-diphosphate-sugar epimerase